MVDFAKLTAEIAVVRLVVENSGRELAIATFIRSSSEGVQPEGEQASDDYSNEAEDRFGHALTLFEFDLLGQTQLTSSAERVVVAAAAAMSSVARL
jgi:hypothetical protein